MKLLDVNLLLYATNPAAPGHDRARAWFEDVMNSGEPVGLPRSTLIAFVRMATHPATFQPPLPMETALAFVEEWLEWDTVWVPEPTPDHAAIFSRLLRRLPRTRLVSDAHLAAIAIGHGLTLCSADADFRMFSELQFMNPLEPV